MTVHVEGDEVVTVTIERPERRNAVNHATLDALVVDAQRATDGGARVIVLTGAGGHFCAGADLTTLEDAKLGLMVDAASSTGSAASTTRWRGFHERRPSRFEGR